MWGGAILGLMATYGLQSWLNNRQTISGTVNEKTFNRARKITTAAAVGVTALVNCVTETKWGVSHLPVADLLGGRVADPLDTLYSAGYAGWLSWFGLRRIEESPTK